jgi:hypothetical protein
MAGIRQLPPRLRSKGDSSFANPTTAISEINSKPRLIKVWARDGMCALPWVNTSWLVVNTGPSTDVNVGRTSPRVASAVTVASAAPVPSALNFTIPCLNVPITRARPTIPFMVIITAANTVSRASVAAPGPPALTRVTIKATSIAVTEIARTREPNGSPTR